jgi:hypothetical protein
MKTSLGLAGIAAAFFGFQSGAHASTITTLDLSAAALSGGVTLSGATLQFAPNAIGTATFTIPSVPGQQIVIDVTGQSNQSSSFVQFFINGVQLGSNTNFGSGLNTIALPSFIDTGSSDVFSITNGGTGNTENQITSITVDPPVPLPATLPLLATGLGGLGLLGWRRKRKAQAGA